MTGINHRDAIRAWMERKGLNAHEITKRAGVSTSVIYNLMAGKSHSLSAGVLQKLAAAGGSTVDEILTGTVSRPYVELKFRIGAGGKVFEIEDEGVTLAVARPAGLAEGIEVSAAEIDGDGLHPIPAGWHVFFRTKPTPPDELVGKMAVVRFSGGGARPVVRTIRRGSEPGTFTLQAFAGTLIEDVEVVAAHEVVSFAAPSQP